MLLRCHGGCEFEAIVSALDMKTADLYPLSRPNGKPRPVKTKESVWPAFHAENGTYIADHVRRSGPNGKKKMFWRGRDGTQGLPEGVGTADLALYSADTPVCTDTVVVTEGQKSADALSSKGIAAVGTVTGASGCPGDVALRPFVDKTVVLWADNDAPGEAHMTKVAVSLRRLGCQDIRQVSWPDAPEKGDAADAVDSGVNVAELITHAVPWEFVTVDLAVLLDDLVEVQTSYVVMSPDQAVAGALWTAHTHAFEAFDATPYMNVGSAEKQSGKTRLLEVWEPLVATSWMTTRTTAAALVRKIDQKQPTLLLDESDAAFKGDKDYAEALRGTLNAGHRRGGVTSVCVGQGSSLEVRDFNVFCPKAIAGIGQLPDTVADRSIRMTLRRRLKTEPVKRFRRRDALTELVPLYHRLATWAPTAVADLRDARPDLPEELPDRAMDGWEPLLAIADRAGGLWPSRARQSAVALSGSGNSDDASRGTQLLHDLSAVFDDQEKMYTKDVIQALCAIEEAPWATYSRQDKPIAANQLSELLLPYGVVPGEVYINGVKSRGYRKESLKDAFSRYVTPAPRHRDLPHGEAVEGISAGLQTTPSAGGGRDGFQPMVQAIVATSRLEPPPTEDREVTDMTCALTGKVCRTCEGVRCVPPIAVSDAT